MHSYKLKVTWFKKAHKFTYILTDLQTFQWIPTIKSYKKTVLEAIVISIIKLNKLLTLEHSRSQSIAPKSLISFRHLFGKLGVDLEQILTPVKIVPTRAELPIRTKLKQMPTCTGLRTFFVFFRL